MFLGVKRPKQSWGFLGELTLSLAQVKGSEECREIQLLLQLSESTREMRIERHFLDEVLVLVVIVESILYVSLSVVDHLDRL